MNLIVMCAMGLIFVGGPLLALLHYRTLPDRPNPPKKIQTLPEDAKIFRPPKWRFIFIDATLISLGFFLVISVMEFVYPFRHSSPYHYFVAHLVVRILFRLFLPWYNVDRLNLIISSESITSTLRSGTISFPIHKIDQKVSHQPNNIKKWLICRYLDSTQRKIDKWLGYKYIYSIEGDKIELSPFVLTKEQINEILNEVDKLTKGIPEDQADDRGEDKVD